MLCVSCEDPILPNKTRLSQRNQIISSGIAQVDHIIAEKSCPQTKLKISKERSATVTPGLLNKSLTQKISVGESVKVSGHFVTNVCGYQGSVRFSCSGLYSIATNRYFSCIQGGVLTGSRSNSQIGNSALNTGNTFTSGKFFMFANGQKMSGTIHIKNQLNHRTCPISFSCL